MEFRGRLIYRMKVAESSLRSFFLFKKWAVASLSVSRLKSYEILSTSEREEEEGGRDRLMKEKDLDSSMVSLLSSYSDTELPSSRSHSN